MAMFIFACGSETLQENVDTGYSVCHGRRKRDEQSITLQARHVKSVVKAKGFSINLRQVQTSMIFLPLFSKMTLVNKTPHERLKKDCEKWNAQF
jgi:hypothetical protein